MTETHQTSASPVSEDVPHSQPPAVRQGVLFLYVAAAIHALLLGTFLLHGVTAEVKGDGLEMRAVFVLLIANLALTALTARRKGWARLALLTLFVVCLPFALLFLLAFLGAPTLLALPLLAGQVLQALGLRFLFRKPASLWYKAAG